MHAIETPQVCEINWRFKLSRIKLKMHERNDKLLSGFRQIYSPMSLQSWRNLNISKTNGGGKFPVVYF